MGSQRYQLAQVFSLRRMSVSSGCGQRLVRMFQYACQLSLQMVAEGSPRTAAPKTPIPRQWPSYRSSTRIRGDKTKIIGTTCNERLGLLQKWLSPKAAQFSTMVHALVIQFFFA